jgi:hypothetical protein
MKCRLYPACGVLVVAAVARPFVDKRVSNARESASVVPGERQTV